MSKHAAEFVALVTDGQIIDGFGKRCEKCGQPTEEGDGRKAKFLKLGRAVMKDLANRLGADPKLVEVNPAGPAVSGDVYLHFPRNGLHVSFWHHQPRHDYGDFSASYGNGPPVWMRWEELLDPKRVTEKIGALEIVPVAGVSIEQLGGTAQVVDVLEALENDLDADEALS